jgi:DNA-binding response OmpR family regulator
MVVIMSAMSDRQNKTEALQQGAFDYVTKPFDLLHIKKVIKDALLLGNH